jgi:hypothetical protein
MDSMKGMKYLWILLQLLILQYYSNLKLDKKEFKNQIVIFLKDNLKLKIILKHL